MTDWTDLAEHGDVDTTAGRLRRRDRLPPARRSSRSRESRQGRSEQQGREGQLAYFEPWGEGMLIRGHDVNPAVFAAELDKVLGIRDEHLVVAKMWLSYQPRVKHCSNYGPPCDQDGEDFHGHWHTVRPTAATWTHWTFARYERRRVS